MSDQISTPLSNHPPLVGSAAPRRALVTGASGFLGRHLVHALLSGGWEVVAIRRNQHAPSGQQEGPDGVTVLHHDGSTQSLVDLLDGLAPQVVFHLATRFVSEHTANDIEPMVRDNVLFGTQLVEAMHRHRVSSLVATASAWQHYGNREYAPVSLYAASKQAFEAMAAWYAEVAAMKVVLPRLTDIYGPNDTRPKLLNALHRAERSGELLRMNDGSPVIDLLHVDDAVRALLLAAERALANAPGVERWAVRPGRPLPLRDVVALWERIRGVQLNVQWNVRPLRARETMQPWIVGDALPAWQPHITLEQGIKSL